MLVHVDSIWFTLFSKLPNWLGRAENARVGDSIEHMRLNLFALNIQK